MIMLRKPTKDPKDVRLRTVLDCRERNANCRKLTSPLPDIEEILRVVSKHPYVSLIDGKDTYDVPDNSDRENNTIPYYLYW